MRSKPCPTQPMLRPLRQVEIDRTIDTLTRQLAKTAGESRLDVSPESRPRWISTAELVRRVRPFIVLN